MSSEATPSGSGRFGPDLVVQGELDGKCDLRIEGTFRGRLDIEGEVTVGPTASIRAPVTASAVVIEGELRGDVSASRSVSIRAGGQLWGDVRSPSISVDDGGVLEGGIEMDFDIEGEDE